MEEFQILSNFNSFMISNALYLAGVSFLIWVTFRAGLRIYDNGAPILHKILVSIFGLGVVFNGLQINAFLQVTWENTAYALSQLDNISGNAQSFVDFLGVTEPAQFSLIPANPIFIVWWLAVVAMMLLPVWVKKDS